MGQHYVFSLLEQFAGMWPVHWGVWAAKLWLLPLGFVYTCNKPMSWSHAIRFADLGGPSKARTLFSGALTLGL